MARILCPACMGYTQLMADGTGGAAGVITRHKIPPEIADKSGQPRGTICVGSLRSVWSLYRTEQVMLERYPDGRVNLPDLSPEDQPTAGG